MLPLPEPAAGSSQQALLAWQGFFSVEGTFEVGRVLFEEIRRHRPVLGPRSYVAAGAVVTTDVPPMHVVTGTNQRTHAAAWPGRGLQELLAHWQRSSD